MKIMYDNTYESEADKFKKEYEAVVQSGGIRLKNFQRRRKLGGSEYDAARLYSNEAGIDPPDSPGDLRQWIFRTVTGGHRIDLYLGRDLSKSQRKKRNKKLREAGFLPPLEPTPVNTQKKKKNKSKRRIPGFIKVTPNVETVVTGLSFSCISDIEPSFAEAIIIKKLVAKGFGFFREVVFPGCVNPITNCSLRFDFYLPAQNILIEYDGVEAHKDEDVRKRDRIKTAFAKENCIKLIRVQGIRNIDYMFKRFLTFEP